MSAKVPLGAAWCHSCEHLGQVRMAIVTDLQQVRLVCGDQVQREEATCHLVALQ